MAMYTILVDYPTNARVMVLTFFWRNLVWQTPFGEVSFGEIHLTKLFFFGKTFYLAKLHLANSTRQRFI